MVAEAGLEDFLNEQGTFVQVTVLRAQGSTPREAGTVMFVSLQSEYGTIGGGQLEYLAIERARSLLASGAETDNMDVPLGPEIGQCCGGRVGLSLSKMDADAKAAALQDAKNASEIRPEIYIFGAGHVGRALADCLALLPVRAILLDERDDELAKSKADIEKRRSALPDADIRNAKPGSAFVILTHDHALDFLIGVEALSRGDAAYTGMIGSATKRAKFVSYCRNEYPELQAGALVCPIGATHSADKRPEVIAAFVAAEIIGVLTNHSG